jgi:hypothetical protein
MKRFLLGAIVAGTVGMLTACGGGGGGGGGGIAFPIVPAAVALSVTVTVNGNAVTAAAGQIAVKPGDVVAISANQATTWTSSSKPDGSIALRNTDISDTKWSARIANPTGTASTLIVSGKATANTASTQDTVFGVSAGDARNGSYKVFAGNGTRNTLALDFDSGYYVMTDENGAIDANVFVSDSGSPGGYFFQSSHATRDKIPNNRFRVSGDTIVGGFPFHAPKVLTAYAVQPFVASRALVTTQSGLDGVFSRLGINMQAASRDSVIRQTQISGGGTLLQLCNEVAITSIAACPAPSLINYTISSGPTPDLWSIVNVADPTDGGTFAIARVNGKNVYLSAGVNPAAPNDAVLRVGLIDTAAWPTTKALGVDTVGAFGTMDLDASTYATVMTRGDTSGFNFSVSSTSASGTVQNLRVFTAAGVTGPANYFVAQDGTLAVIVGARGGEMAGYMQIGLMR